MCIVGLHLHVSDVLKYDNVEMILRSVTVAWPHKIGSTTYLHKMPSIATQGVPVAIEYGTNNLVAVQEEAKKCSSGGSAVLKEFRSKGMPVEIAKVQSLYAMVVRRFLRNFSVL